MFHFLQLEASVFVWNVLCSTHFTFYRSLLSNYCAIADAFQSIVLIYFLRTLYVLLVVNISYKTVNKTLNAFGEPLTVIVLEVNVFNYPFKATFRNYLFKCSNDMLHTCY